MKPFPSECKSGINYRHLKEKKPIIYRQAPWKRGQKYCKELMW